ncbi:MAG TPA: HAD-IA family hydrolase [Thermoanaerobaculaceae bacterium]|nr:HAD-IA family hydrolase [Thermoanaerobaculaceae bacterium]
MQGEPLRPAALLFDLDGTLADSFEGIRVALDAALREEGLPEFDLAWVRTHVGRGAPALVRDAVGAGADDALVRAVGVRFADHYRATFLDLTPALPGAHEVLAYVARRTGGKVAVISNKYEELSRSWLLHTGLAEHVAAVVGPDTYGVRKPDPGVALPILRSFGVSPPDALVVGDMEVDVATARALGAPIVAVQADPEAARALLAAGAAAVLGALGGLPRWLSDNGTGWRYHEAATGEATR